MKRTKTTILGGWLASITLLGCGPIDPSSQESNVFAAPDGYYSCGDGVGILPDNRPDLTPEQKEGRCTWEIRTGGTEHLYRKLTVKTEGRFDLLNMIDTSRTPRADRMEKFGAINDPGCEPTSEPDKYGYYFDDCIDPHSTGVIGTRKFRNPAFDEDSLKGGWSVDKYWDDQAEIEPPWLVGITCGSCHVGFDPENPPGDINNPTWDELHSTIANQYLHEGGVFGVALHEDEFAHQVLMTQQRGTSDTSRVATDHINNPNSINSIFNLGQRVAVEEEQLDGTMVAVPHVLKDGSDSIGIAGAALRVFVNTGICSDQWLPQHDAITGKKDQKPITLSVLRDECEDFRSTEALMPNMAAFLASHGPPRLANAPGGDAYMDPDPSVMALGKRVFAENCATCHSSTQPPVDITGADAIGAWFSDAVLAEDFFEKNFLSDDKRYPVTELGTNIARSVATNAKAGHIWNDFSSEDYKRLPSPGTLELWNPTGDPIEFEVPGGGNGYYRTPSLTGMWATAPWLHNNSLGKYTGDPSVQGRMDAFDDAVVKLLWPDAREGVVKYTSRETTIELPWMPDITVPAGTPVNVLASLDQRSWSVKAKMLKLSIFGHKITEKAYEGLLEKSQSPDLIEDKGHYFGTCGTYECGDFDVPHTDLSEEEKYALVELLKTL